MRLSPSRLRPEVVAAEHGALRLGDDLARFARVVDADAPEAAALYAGRILEVLAAAQVRALARTPSNNVYGNLTELAELGTLGELTGRLAHALRRLANEARHVHRALDADDAVLAQVLLERVLAWHFTRFPLGPRLPGLHAERIDPSPHPLARFVEALEAGTRAWSPALERSPLAAGLYAETLIAAGGTDELAAADACVTAALARDPEDLQLRQLDAWITRQRGGLDVAIEKLEALYAESEDVETTGLLAGSYKRRWSASTSGKRHELLKRTADLYHRAWKRGDRRSSYVGVNAATMSLLDGDPARARTIASVIDASYEQRRGLLSPGRAIAFTGYWDLATYAEVKLLIGDRDEAARAYREAFTRYADQRGSIASTRAQLALLTDPDELLATPHPETSMPTYRPRPLAVDDVSVPPELRELCERLAEQVHENWSAMRLADGWQLGAERDDTRKQHPCLVPYDQLPESEKDIDRGSVSTVVKSILAMGFEIKRP